MKNIKNWLVSGLAALLIGITVACTLPPWVVTAERIAGAAVPIAASVITLVDPALAPVVTLVENGFSALDNALKQYEASPTTTNLQAVDSAVIVLQNNETQLESALQVKNSHTDAVINSVLALISTSLTEVEALIPAQAPLSDKALALGLSAKPKAKGLNADDIKKQYNADIKGDYRFKGKAFKLGVHKLY